MKEEQERSARETIKTMLANPNLIDGLVGFWTPGIDFKESNLFPVKDDAKRN